MQLLSASFHRSCSRGAAVVARMALLTVFVGPPLFGFDFNAEQSCVLLNNENTDILTRPADCDFLDPVDWCNCTRTALTNPIRGETTSVEQGVIWVTEEPGIGNHRVEVSAGTLDVSSLSVGNVIGGTLANELVPESVGVPPGTFLTTESDMVVTGIDSNVVEFDIRLVAVSPITPVILNYNPFDAAHSNGLLYRGQLTANGPGGGFTFEYRYEAEAGADSPAIEPSDAGGPGFNVRFSFSMFTDDAEGIYTLPDAGSIEFDSTLRKFREENDVVADPAEILPLGSDDLCEPLEGGELVPCRVFSDVLDLSNSGGGNNPPEAVVVATDAGGNPLFNDEVFVDCGEARAILRGSNSTDGDGGAQGLSFLWEVVDEPDDGAAVIPPETAEFMDTEVTMLIPGGYTFRLTVDDGQPEDNIDFIEIDIEAVDGVGPNLPPEVTSLTYRPDGGDEVELLTGDDPVVSIPFEDGTGEIIDLDADTSTGDDGCSQQNAFLWEAVSGPGNVTFSSALDEETDVTFDASGEYLLRLTLDDGAPEDNIGTLDVVVEVGTEGVGPFLRGDCNQDGDNVGSPTDGIFLLTFLFSGGLRPFCIAACDFDGNGSVSGDPTDALFFFNFNFLGGPPMQPPLRDCAVSSRAGDIALGCDDPRGCR